MSFLGELRRRNVVKVAVAYAIVGWLLIEVSSVIGPAMNLPDWATSLVVFLVILGFPLALILSWAYELTPEGMKRSHEVEASESVTQVTGRKIDFAIIGALVLALGFVVYNYVLDDGAVAVVQETVTPAVEPVAETPAPVVVEEQLEALPNSVAVLLCDNLSPDPDDAYFAAGIHEEILNQLVKLRNLNVIARTSVLQYADAPPPIPQIAEELNVGAVVECSVRFAGNAIMVTAQLIDPETNSHLWSDTYPGDLSDLSTVFAMQADIAMNIANAVGAEFSLEEQESIEKRPTESPEAYAYYLRALGGANERIGIILLGQAIEADPDFALAYALKAVWSNFGLVGIGGVGPDEATELERTVQSDAEKALVLDPTLGVAHAALAVPHFVNWRGAEAEEEFQRAIALSPNDVNVLVLYGRFKRFRGEFEEAIRLARRAVELDPNNLGSLNQLAQHYRRSENFEAASAIYSDVLNRGLTGVGIYAGAATVEALLGNHAEAVGLLQIAEQLGQTGIRLAQMAHVYALAGQPDDAMRLFAKFEQEVDENPISDAVWIRALIAVGNYDQALQRLESAVQDRTLTDVLALTAIEANPWNDPELDKPEFRRLVSNLWNDE